jgi:hypothetical protein
VSLADRVKSSAKILVVDIERLPGLARIWEPKTRYVNINNFTRMPSLLCFAAKWYGSKATEFHAAWDDRDAMLQRAWDMYNEAEIVVTYNGVRFDNKHLKSDWLVAGMPPPAPWKDVDLYAVNSRTFGFESKSLQHLCYRLGLDLKSGHYDAVMAEKCMDGDPAAQKTMARYNKGDVKITEQAYDRLRGWIPSHPHSLMGTADDRRTCNQCWGDNLERNGTKLAQQITYTMYRCLDCGANVQGTRHSRAAITRGAS